MQPPAAKASRPQRQPLTAAGFSLRHVRSLTPSHRHDAAVPATIVRKATFSLGRAVKTLANELSRVGDRLTRARERTWNGTAHVWVPTHARREPARAEIPSDLPGSRRDAGAETKRVPSTLVAIHVEVRHPTGDAEPTARVIDAHVAEVDDPEHLRYDQLAAIGEGFFAPAEPQPVFALPAAYTSEASASQKQARPNGVIQYLAARALSAYMTQHTFVSAGSREGRLLDLRV